MVQRKKKVNQDIRDNATGNLGSDFVPESNDDLDVLNDEEYIGEKGGESRDVDLDMDDIDVGDENEFRQDKENTEMDDDLYDVDDEE